MFTLTYLNIVTIILDVSAIILVLGILRQTRFMRQSGRESDRLFRSMLIFTCVMAVGDIGGYLTMDQEDAILIGLQNISMTVFYIALTMLVMLWFDYCSFRFRDREQVVKIGVRPAFIPGVLVLGIVFINNSTGLFFRIDEMGHYHREILFLPIYVVYAVYLIAGFVYIGKYRTAEKKVLIPLWLYIAPIVVSGIVTFAVGEISMAALGTALTIVFTHLGTMNEIAEISMKESAL